jgi:hypothetical protein
VTLINNESIFSPKEQIMIHVISCFLFPVGLVILYYWNDWRFTLSEFEYQTVGMSIGLLSLFFIGIGFVCIATLGETFDDIKKLRSTSINAHTMTLMMQAHMPSPHQLCMKFRRSCPPMKKGNRHNWGKRSCTG